MTSALDLEYSYYCFRLANSTIFVSFTSQLNFYGFQKLRSDPDLQIHTTSVRFQHEYFRKDEPELLNMIQRSTAGRPSAAEVKAEEKLESSQKEIEELKQKIQELESTMEKRVNEAAKLLEMNYMARISKLEASYESLLSILVKDAHRASSPTVWASALPWYQPSAKTMTEYSPSDIATVQKVLSTLPR